LKKLLLPLAMLVLVLFSACSGDTLPTQGNADTPVETVEEARNLLQSWLNNHPFTYPVIINDSMTIEDETGFTFVLYQDSELARIRVAKATGRLLWRNSDADSFISIDGWYTRLGYSLPQYNLAIVENVATDDDSAQETGTQDIVQNNDDTVPQHANATETEAPQTAEPSEPALQADITELRRLFVSYFNHGRNADRNSLRQTNPEELYNAVISLMITNQSRDEITVNQELDRETIRYIGRVCDTFLGIFDTGAESDRIRDLRGYVTRITSYNEERDALIRAYRTDDGNLLTDNDRNIYTRRFYIRNPIEITSNSAVERFLIDMGMLGGSTPPSFGATMDYEIIFGSYFPGSQICVVRPVNVHRFPRAGIYTLNVIQSGEIEVVDLQGFRSFVPLFVEVSDEFHEQFFADLSRFHAIEGDIFSAEQSIRNFILGISVETPAQEQGHQTSQAAANWLNLGAVSIPPTWSYDNWAHLEILPDFALGTMLQIDVRRESNDEIAWMDANAWEAFQFAFDDGNTGWEYQFNGSTVWVNGNWSLTLFHNDDPTIHSLISDNWETVNSVVRSLRRNP